MKPFLLVAPVVLLAAGGCAPRHDVFVGWTIGGLPAAQACLQLAEPRVRLQVDSRDVEGGDVVEQTVTAPCADNPVRLQTAAFADIFVDLLDGEAVYGGGGPLHVAPGGGDEYPGFDREAPLMADLALARGRLRARLTIVGQSCGDTAAAELTVSLRRNTGPLGREIVVDGVPVSCNADGEAIFEHAPVEVGSLYEVSATTTIEGVEYATSDGGTGEGAVVSGGMTDLVVDLDVVGRP